MELFLYEHLSAIAPERNTGNDAARPLAREGEAMLRAVLEDCCRLRGANVHFAWSHRLPLPVVPPNARPVSVSGPGALDRFEEWARRADATLLIAPELDGELFRLATLLEECGGYSLGSPATAIHAAADKLELPRRLASLGVRSLPAAPLSAMTDVSGPDLPGPWVAKPRFGAGATGVELLSDISHVTPTETTDRIVTPFIDGRAVSVAVLVGPEQAMPLEPCTQRIRGGTQEVPEFSYHGGRLPLPGPQAARAQALALRAVEAVPGLRGFIGVDLLLADDGAHDIVVEINPRLTSSYFGLRALTDTNLTALWIDIINSRPTALPDWHPTAVEFFCNGRVEVLR